MAVDARETECVGGDSARWSVEEARAKFSSERGGKKHSVSR